MTLPLPPVYPLRLRCDICGTPDNLIVTMQLCSDPPQPCEWMCAPCIKAVEDAREQRFGVQRYFIEKKKSKKPKKR